MAEAAPATHGATIDPGASVTAYNAAGHIIPTPRMHVRPSDK